MTMTPTGPPSTIVCTAMHQRLANVTDEAFGIDGSNEEDMP